MVIYYVQIFESTRFFICFQRASHTASSFLFIIFWAKFTHHKPDHCVLHHILLLRVSNTKISTISPEQDVT